MRLTVGLIRGLKLCKTLFSKGNSQFNFLVYVRPPNEIHPTHPFRLIHCMLHKEGEKNNYVKDRYSEEGIKRRR